MSDKDFSGVDFAVGEVRGFREWRVDTRGVLFPLSHSGDWLPGENSAVCKCYPGREVLPEREGEDWKERSERVKAWKESPHFKEGTHGFYAYWDGETGSYAGGKPVVSGVIDGYGEVLIGTKGFRAMKARIVALAVEPHDGMWELSPFVVQRIEANYPGVPLFQSSLAMRVEFPAPRPEFESVA